jgi:hypothetical protein
LGWSAAVLVVSLLPLALGWARLPDPVATHWGVDGDPDGRMALVAVPWLAVGLIAVALSTTSLFRVEGTPSAEAFAMVGVMGGLGTALMGLLVYLNWDASAWDEAGHFDLWHGGGPRRRLCGRACRFHPGSQTPNGATGPAGRRPRHRGRPGGTGVLGGPDLVRWPLILLGGAMLAVILLPEWGLWSGGLLGLLALAFMRVEANVNNDGLTVRLGGIPVRRIPVAKISSARAIDLEPAQWGGWGWRAAPNGSAIVLRRGDALELTFRGGRRFAVTVDDAATGAALLNGLVARLLGEA